MAVEVLAGPYWRTQVFHAALGAPADVDPQVGLAVDPRGALITGKVGGRLPASACRHVAPSLWRESLLTLCAASWPRPCTCALCGSDLWRALLLVVPEANEGTEYAECHPQRPRFRAKEYRRKGDEDLTPGDDHEYQRSGLGPLAVKTEPLPPLHGRDNKVHGNPINHKTYEGGESPDVMPRMVIDRAAHATDSNERCQDANDRRS